VFLRQVIKYFAVCLHNLHRREMSVNVISHLPLHRGVCFRSFSSPHGGSFFGMNLK
jgi:hypothetical protein